MPFDPRQLAQVLGAAGGLRGNRGFADRWQQLEQQEQQRKQQAAEQARQSEMLGFQRDANTRAANADQRAGQDQTLQAIASVRDMLGDESLIEPDAYAQREQFVLQAAPRLGVDPGFIQSLRPAPDTFTKRKLQSLYGKFEKLPQSVREQMEVAGGWPDPTGETDPVTGKVRVLSPAAVRSMLGHGMVQSTGELAAFTPAPKPNAMNAGSFEDYTTRYAKDRGKTADQLTSADIEDARKRYQQADDRPRITVNTGRLSPPSERRVNQLADAFRADPIVKRTNIMAEAVSFVQSLDPNSDNAADDQALIYAFAKAMDPESVVREGEYATVQKYAQSWLQSFGFNVSRILNNQEFLSKGVRSNLKATIQKRYASGRTQYDNVRRQYAKQINQITQAGDGEEYLINYAEAFPAAEETRRDPAGARPTVTPSGEPPARAGGPAPRVNPYRPGQ